MRPEPRSPPRMPLVEYVEDGARIAGILLVWGVIAAVVAFGFGALGGRSSLLTEVGVWLGSILGLTGVLNAVLYVVYRALDYREMG